MSICDFEMPLPSESQIIGSWQTDIVRVSICCVTYNHVNFIEKAIKSFLFQKTDFAFEILIHDDASTDGTQDVILKYHSLYPNIIKPIIQEENIYSRNGKPLSVLFDSAIGDYFALCEGDDYWRDERKIYTQYNLMKLNPNLSITYHRSLLVKDCVETTEFSLPVKCYKNYSSKSLTTGKAAISTQTVMVTNALATLPEEFFNVTNEDSFLFVLAGLHGDGQYIDDIQPSAYRIHEGGVWSEKVNFYRNIKMAESYYWISIHLERVKRKYCSNIFKFKAAKIIFRDKNSKFALLSTVFKHFFLR